jgi:amicyanin
MRKLLAVVLLAIMLVASISILGCGSSSTSSGETATTTQPSGNTVILKSSSFQPSSITVSAGDTVTWINEDAVDHTVTGDKTGSGDDFDSGTMKQGQQFTHVFDQAGTYPYHCSIHPNMKGTVVVTGG